MAQNPEEDKTDPKIRVQTGFYGNREYEKEDIPGRELPDHLAAGHEDWDGYDDYPHDSRGDDHASKDLKGENFYRSQSYVVHDDLGPQHLQQQRDLKEGHAAPDGNPEETAWQVRKRDQEDKA